MPFDQSDLLRQAGYDAGDVIAGYQVADADKSVSVSSTTFTSVTTVGRFGVGSLAEPTRKYELRIAASVNGDGSDNTITLRSAGNPASEVTSDSDPNFQRIQTDPLTVEGLNVPGFNSDPQTVTPQIQAKVSGGTVDLFGLTYSLQGIL